MGRSLHGLAGYQFVGGGVQHYVWQTSQRETTLVSKVLVSVAAVWFLSRQLAEARRGGAGHNHGMGMGVCLNCRTANKHPVDAVLQVTDSSTAWAQASVLINCFKPFGTKCTLTRETHAAQPGSSAQVLLACATS